MVSKWADEVGNDVRSLVFIRVADLPGGLEGGYSSILVHYPGGGALPVETRDWRSGAWYCRRIEKRNLASSIYIEVVTGHEDRGGSIDMVTLFLLMARQLAISHLVFTLQWDFASSHVRRAPQHEYRHVQGHRAGDDCF